jgi:prepilin-type N-terminal cleavage/methylation domain-containing protein
MMNFKKAFTLPEVLITLSIIGIVAALTMPALVASYQKHVTVTKLKKGVSVLAQAYTMAADEGTPPERVWNNADYAVALTEYLYKPYLKNIEIKKMSMGVSFPLSDGTGIYLRDYGGMDWLVFCIDYKKCNMSIFDGWTAPWEVADGKNSFILTPSSVPYAGTDRDTILNQYCTAAKKVGCAGLIQNDGWEIKDDYPW